MGCLLWRFKGKLTALQRHRAVYCRSREVPTGDSSSAPTAFVVSDDRAAIPKIPGPQWCRQINKRSCKLNKTFVRYTQIWMPGFIQSFRSSYLESLEHSWSYNVAGTTIPTPHPRERLIISMRPNMSYGTYNWVIVGTGGDLLPNGTKPPPHPRLTHQERDQAIVKIFYYFITAPLHDRHGVSNFQHIWNLSYHLFLPTGTETS